MTLRRFLVLASMLLLGVGSLYAQAGFGITVTVRFISVELQDIHNAPHPGWNLGVVDTHTLYTMVDSQGVYVRNQSNVPLDVAMNVADLGPDSIWPSYTNWVPEDSLINPLGFRLEMIWATGDTSPADWSAAHGLIDTIRTVATGLPPGWSPWAFLRFRSPAYATDTYIHRFQVTWIFTEH